MTTFIRQKYYYCNGVRWFNNLSTDACDTCRMY